MVHTDHGDQPGQSSWESRSTRYMRRVVHVGGSGDGSGLESLTGFVPVGDVSDSRRRWARVGPGAASGRHEEGLFMSRISHSSSHALDAS